MADRRPEIRALLTSEAIEHITFRVALRGYDTAQVREYLKSVADHVRTLQGQTDMLTMQLREAEARADHPVIGPDQLTSALGEETARILKSAHEAADDIRGRAEEHVERVVQQARDESSRLTAEAASILDVRRTAAEAEAAEILRVARDEAKRLVEEATAAAAATTSGAAESALKAVEDAKAERNEVLSDVRRRRRVANTQIEQLRAGRERLLQAYEVVRSTLEQVTNELDVADVEAKAAAEEVGRRMNAAIDPLRADALGAAPVVDLTEPEPPKAVEAPKLVEQPKPKHESRPHRKGGKGARPPVVKVEEPPRDPNLPKIGDTRPAPAPVVVEVPKPEPIPEPVVEPEPVVAEVVEEPVVEEPKPEPDKAEGLFDRIRKEQEEQAAAEPEPTPEPEPEPEKPVGLAAERVAARNATCGALEDHLTRRVKRALQDEQNLVLDRLRSVRGSLNADAALGAESEHLTTYATIVEPALADAARAGAAAAGNPIEVPADLVAAVANDLAMELVLPLRRQLDERLHEATAVGDDQITASDRVSSAYREAKTHRVGRLSADWLVAAWSVGVHAATKPGAPGEWAADPAKPCCTDCDDNGLAGGVPKGTAFPTGHLHPPAHPGCRCVVVPTT